MNVRAQLAALYDQYGFPTFSNVQLADLPEEMPYKAGVWVLADVQEKVVLIRRKPHPDWPGVEALWWLPGGAHEPGEALHATAVREFREETGLEIHVDRLLLVQFSEERFFRLWFRGHVTAGKLSSQGDPCSTTAEAAAFARSALPAEALASDLDKIVLAHEAWIDLSTQDLVAKYGMQTQ